MRFLLLCLAVLVLAVLAGQALLVDTGVVLIGFHGVMIRTSVVVFGFLLILLVVTLYAAVHLSRRLWRAPRDLRFWNRRRREAKAQAGLARGLLALAGGDWPQAESSLSKAAIAASDPLLHYLGAARAAAGLQAADRRDRYLTLAASTGAEGELAVLLMQGDAAVAAGDAAAARSVLERLRERQPGHAQVRRLELGCARAAGDWGAVLGLLPGLAKDRIISERERDAFETEAFTALSAETKGLPSRTVLREVWERLPKARRAQPVLIALYARELAAAGQGEEAEKLVRAALNKHWDPNLICTYGQIHAGDGLRSIKHAEAWLAEHGPLPELLLTLGRLCIRAGLWGKARSYLEGLVGKAPSAEACRLLAETLEQLGDREAALRCHRQGLLIATGGSTAIPALPARQPG